MGVLGLLVPEADGGLGWTRRSLVPILEEAGRVALPHPLVETAMVAGPAARRRPAGLVATDVGRAVRRRCAADADALLLRAGSGLVRAEPVRRSTLEPAATVDGARRAAHASTVTGQTHRPSPTTPPSWIWRSTEGRSAPRRTSSASASRCSTSPSGTSPSASQFGVPIGSFQAVKHHLADAALALEFARPAVLRAAWSVAHDEPTRARDVSMAKAMASDAAELVGRKALQCHGAIGYTVEYDLHL